MLASLPDTQPSATPAPHLDITPDTVTTIETPSRTKPADEPFVWGQVLAYLGVLGLTGGAAMIIWGYFGDSPVDGPTAWLVAAAGQMLLFLGVITIVSNGIDQTNQDVICQVRKLGDQLLRIEQATDHPRVPSPKSNSITEDAQAGETDRVKVSDA